MGNNDKMHLDNAIGLHPDNVNWRSFLESVCTLNQERNGYKWYNATNCHYIVTPDGHIEQYFGFWGRSNFHRLAYGVFSYHLDGHIER